MFVERMTGRKRALVGVSVLGNPPVKEHLVLFVQQIPGHETLGMLRWKSTSKLVPFLYCVHTKYFPSGRRVAGCTQVEKQTNVTTPRTSFRTA